MEAWRRYENEPNILYRLLFLLDQEAQRGVIDIAWIEQEWSDIDTHLANMEGAA